MNPQPAPRRMENLAFVFQELLTVGERLRSNRQQVADAPTFRDQIWGGVKLADDDGRKRGYSADDIELATFAVVAFLDESILNLRSPVFADWPRQPLQEERYGHHIAGEIFFQNLQKLMSRSDSQDLADLLEVYYLCLLLGFAGKYSLGGRGDLRGVAMQTGERIQRIRQTGAELAPGWRLPSDGVRGVSGDPWVLRLGIAAGVCFLILVASFAGYYMSLSSGVTNLQTTARTAK
jgi:type VI secretion system protein ImpK